MDAFGWEVVGSIAGVLAVVVAVVIWLFPSPRGHVNGSAKSVDPHLSAAPSENSIRSSQIVFGEVPQRSLAFEDRSELQGQLIDSSVTQGHVWSLVGTRGAGKSQLAAAVARKRIAEGWRLVAWINAEFPGQLIEQLTQLAAELGLSSSDSRGSAAARLRHWLETGGDHCLLIFDNALDADAIQSVLPIAGNSHVIITSSRRPLANIGQLIPVGAFTPRQAENFLASRIGRSDESGANALASELGYLPLALSQAAAVLVGQNLDYATYRARLASVRISDSMSHVEGDSYALGVAEAIMLSISAMAEGALGRICRQVLELLSVLSPSGVSRRLLYGATGANQRFRPFQRGEKTSIPAIKLRAIATSEAAMDEALQALSDASLLTWSIDGSSVFVHRLVARVVRERADHDGTVPATFDRAISILARILDIAMAEEDRGRGRGLLGEIVVHVTALSKNLTSFGQSPNAAYSKALEHLQYLSLAYFAGFSRGFRNSLDKKRRVSSAEVAGLEGLMADMESLKDSIVGTSISKELAEAKEHLARMREQMNPDS